MSSAMILRSEVAQYLILATQLKAQYAEIDDETLHDTLEGISNLPDLIQAVVRSGLEDEALAGALKQRLEEMQERLARFKARSDKKRALACWGMTAAGIDKMQAPEFSLSLRQGAQRLEIVDDTKIPGEFFIPQPSRLDRAGLIGSLKRGDPIEGATLVPGETHLAVRVR